MSTVDFIVWGAVFAAYVGVFMLWMQTEKRRDEKFKKVIRDIDRSLDRTIANAAARDSCPECRGVGWLLNERHRGKGNDSGPITLDLLPCIYPTCVDKPRPIATLGIRGQFAAVVRHPVSGSVTALTGFTEPEYR